LIELIDREKSEIDIKLLSPLTWAYVGDSVYELLIRTHLVNKTKLKPHRLHIEAIKYVKAKSQADILKKLEQHLTDEEKDIVRRGRNAENHHLPKNANVEEYMYSTAFEALIGYLYLCKKDERLKEIFNLILDEN
jgi:ribonuclease-3 family protein